MPPRNPISILETHNVENQPVPLVNYNLFDTDPVLSAATKREGAGWARERLSDFGRKVGSEEVQDLAEQANRFPPELRVFDRFGQRLDEVRFHPAYHELMRLAKTSGMHSIAWAAPQKGGHVAHMALEYMMIQVEPGICCPITMTHAAAALIRTVPRLAEDWLPLILADEYDPRVLPASEKSGLTIGMAMTEKQGGSDVRANMTRAIPLGSAGEYELIGHKWFCSAPMSDAFITLAQAPGGLSCFFVPRWRAGARNPFHLQRLKDKLGDRSNASAEIEYDHTFAQLVGAEGEGVRTIMDMVHQTRLDTTLAAAGLMRQGVVQAVHHASHRSAFQRKLVDQPLMRNVLADLVVEWAAATLLCARVARSFDEAEDAPSVRIFSRLAVAASKYWLNKRLIAHAGEAMECLGGAGYIEDSPMPRLFRQAPVNGIWEGSGNVICLDVLRTLKREPLALELFLEEVKESVRSEARMKRPLQRLLAELKDPHDLELRARRINGLMAVLLQGDQVLRHGPPALKEAFCQSRLAKEGASTFGALPAGVDFEALIDLARIPL